MFAATRRAMSRTTYTYSKKISFPTGLVSGELFSIIERNDKIKKKILSVTELDPPSTDVQITFAEALSNPGEKDVLDSIVTVYRPIAQIPEEVVVQEESTKTGGHFQSFTIPILADCLATTAHDEVMFVDTSALSIHYVTAREHMGDEFSVHVSPDTIVGAIIADVSAGDTVLYVSPDVFKYAYRGPCLASLFDGVRTENLGRIRSLDEKTLSVVVEMPSKQTFVAHPVPRTYFRITAALVHNYRIGPPWEYVVGDSKIGGSYVRQGTVVRTIYTNRSPPVDLGKIIEDVKPNDTVIHVEEKVFDTIVWGDKVDLCDKTQAVEPLGTVCMIDHCNCQITVTKPSTKAFSVASPTYLRKTAKQLIAKAEILQ